MTQVELARRLDTDHSELLRRERRADMLLSKLRRFVEATDGDFTWS